MQMDIWMLGLAVVPFVVSVGLIELCDRMQESK